MGEFSTLGGWIATRSAGQNSNRYGKIEDMVAGVRRVSPLMGCLLGGSRRRCLSKNDWYRRKIENEAHCKTSCVC